MLLHILCWYFSGNLLDESDVLDWMLKQKTDMSIEEVNREMLNKYIETKEFLAVVFCKFVFIMLLYPKIYF